MDYNNSNNRDPHGSNGKSPMEEKKGPRFNIYWIYGIIAFSLIGLMMFNNGVLDNSKEITFLEFKNKYLEQDKVKEVVIVNKEYAEIYLKKPDSA